MFSLICYILAAAAITKGLVGIFAHDQLYGWVEKHYSKEGKSFTVILFLFYGIGILALTWYATLTDYVKYGWILTTFISLSSLKLVGIIFKWDKVSQKFVDFVRDGGKKLKILDLIVTGVGIVFILTGLYIY